MKSIMNYFLKSSQISNGVKRVCLKCFCIYFYYKKYKNIIQKIEENIIPAIKPEREEANVLPILNLNCRCSSEIKSLDKLYVLFIFFYCYFYCYMYTL